jgi:hypothetical protein
MSFDIFCQPSRYQKTTTPAKEDSALPDHIVSDPLRADEVRAVLDVLTKHGLRNSESNPGSYNIEFDDSGVGDLFAENLEMGCMIAVRKYSPKMANFLFELLCAANWHMLPVNVGYMAIATSAAYLTDLPDDYPEVHICKTAEEIGMLLSDGYLAGKSYRDDILSS